MLEIGSVIGGKYKVLHKIGKGGMSNVYLVMNERANKQWAVKEVRRDGGKNRDVIRQSLITETSILQKLRHPNLPSIIDIIENEDSFLILMDYIEGITLQEKLDEEGAQSQQNVVRWSCQLCDVLNYLHTRKPAIIYRDMKPSNVMLKPDGDVVLIDFGTAREYAESKEADTTWLGTKGYAAPEQFGGSGQTDVRTDIYNLGATMYHLVTGHNPSRYPYEIYPIRKWDPSLSSGLEEIIEKCTKNDPAERYQNCEDLMYALEHYTELESGMRRKRKLRFRSFAAVCLGAAASFVASIWAGVKADTLQRRDYSSYLRAAEIAATPDKMAESYKRAINVNPGLKTAYVDLLDHVYLADGTFSPKEAEDMISVLGSYPEGRSITAEQALREHPEEYDELAYRLGLAYFYYYGEDGNKSLARPWLAIAKESPTLEPGKRLRAERFSRVADYYIALGNKDKAGDSPVSYAQFWDDMTSLLKGDIRNEDNVNTELVMCRELLYQIMMHANDFRREGVSEEEMSSEIGQIEERLRTITDTDASISDTVEKVRGMLPEAKDAVKTAFHAEGEAYVRD